MHRRSRILTLLCAMTAGPVAGAEAATLSVTPTGSDAAACTPAAPCRSLGRAHAVAAAGDVVTVAPGSYGSQTIPSGTKAVTFRGGPGVVLGHLSIDAANTTFDGINVDVGGRKQLGVLAQAPNITFKNASVGDVVDEKGLLSAAACVGCVYDNVTFHDVRIATDGVHNECLYSQSPNVVIRNSRFTNCATMDVFFTRGTWWGQPTYGGFTLQDNHFGRTYKFGGGVHYYSVYWGQTGNGAVDRATITGNTFELPIGSNFPFTNSVESCNTPRVDAPGLTHATCSATPSPPTPAPTPTPTPAPAPTPAPPPPPAPTPAPAPPSLVGAWSFDEASGTQTADSSGRGNTGTLVAGARRVPGKTGNAIAFDGIDDHVVVPATASLDLTGGMTLEAWVYATAASGGRTAVFKENRAAGRQTYALYAAEDGGRPTVEVLTTKGPSALNSAQATTTGRWMHIAATYDGANLRIYQDGALVGTKAQTGALTVTKDPLKIGGNAVWPEYFQGVIDDVRVFDAPRTQAQIRADMATPVR